MWRLIGGNLKVRPLLASLKPTETGGTLVGRSLSSKIAFCKHHRSFSFLFMGGTNAGFVSAERGGSLPPGDTWARLATSSRICLFGNQFASTLLSLLGILCTLVVGKMNYVRNS